MDFAENEHKILKFWEENKIFEKLREKNKGRERWSFLDGPITANNPMGVHHAWGRTYKDMFQRYKALRGYDLRWQNGFDCQGLWVEVEVEKELGFKTKKDIEKYGLERFVNKCKERVLKFSKMQTEQSIRLGQWADWEHSYFTMSDANNYAIWAFLKKCHSQGILYKGKDSVPWCPRCGTAISQHEILTEEYKELTHKAVFLRLAVKGVEKTYFLVWTTTPWTLPGNVALAVHPELNYAKIKDTKGDTYFLLRQKANLIKNGEVIDTLSGKELAGLEYEGMFDDMEAVKKTMQNKKHQVILWEDISEEEGTGIVHIAPGCGSEDFGLAKELGLPVLDLSDQESKYREGFGDLSGKFVGLEEVRVWIFDALTRKGNIFKIEDYTHRYPTCWRCKAELIFRVVDEWYIAMDKPLQISNLKSQILNLHLKTKNLNTTLREQLIESAKKINWLPGFGLERELDWLNNMHDWLISKKRYWGLALPIFECPCGAYQIVGSLEELKEKAVEGWKDFEDHSPHRPWVDNVKIKCEKCGKSVSRIKDVGTPWLDAGIVPFSTLSDDNRQDNIPYFFGNREEWQKWFPIEFICESFPGQFKNWFYVLLVMSQVLEATPPFRAVLGFASVVDEKGEEMHKSKGNAIWFDEAVEKISADVMRWVYVKQNPVANMRFGYKKADETKRKLLVLLNCYTFFETYKSEKTNKSNKTDKTELDRWILSRFNRLVKEATLALDQFTPNEAANALERFFIEDLSLWYIRRSRKRFNEAEPVLGHILLGLAKIIAPMMPFLAETVYQKIKSDEMPLSVHLCDWPAYDEKMINSGLEAEMAEVRAVVSSALAKRAEKGIGVRQPLQKLTVKSSKFKIKDGALADLIKEEVNVKEVVFDENIKDEVELDTAITPALEEEGQVREIIRHIQDLRKKAGLTPKDEVCIYYSSNRLGLRELLARNQDIILKTTKSHSLEESEKHIGNFVSQQKVVIGGQELWLGLEKL